MSSLDGKSAVVTGATRGIGLAIARALLARGGRVFICARDSADVQKTIDSLRSEHRDRAHGAACDVRSYDNVRSLFRNVKHTFGALDILINNAGIGSHSYVEQMPVEEWNATIETNISGVYYCCHEALPLMKANGSGYIINIGSLAGKHPSAGSAAYCASKFALLGFSESLMQEVRFDHIRVSHVMPGSVNTSFGRSGGQDPSKTWKLSPEDVAAVVINLLEMDPRALPSQVELRPSEPKK
ncbi:MAG TPA: SDR family oxidoreductase [Blastocatellia bacterium]|nr:SDR family oxidoreductase [Blastocatellia bacterium]